MCVRLYFCASVFSLIICARVCSLIFLCTCVFAYIFVHMYVRLHFFECVHVFSVIFVHVCVGLHLCACVCLVIFCAYVTRYDHLQQLLNSRYRLTKSSYGDIVVLSTFYSYWHRYHQSFLYRCTKF